MLPRRTLMPLPEELEKLTVRETFSRLTVDELRASLALVCGPVRARKPELVDQLASIMEKPEKVRALYDDLEDLAKKAVQEAAHDPEGSGTAPGSRPSTAGCLSWVRADATSTSSSRPRCGSSSHASRC
jgi:hypothetical protein